MVDATLGTSLPDAIRTNPDIVRLFPNYVDIEKEYYKRTRIYPIMHLVAIRKDIYEKYPFVATSLYDAFVESKKIALENMFNLRALRYMTPCLMRDIDEIHEVFDGDPWPYGIEPNRPTLEALMTYLTDQSLIAAPVPIDDCRTICSSPILRRECPVKPGEGLHDLLKTPHPPIFAALRARHPLPQGERVRSRGA